MKNKKTILDLLVLLLLALAVFYYFYRTEAVVDGYTLPEAEVIGIDVSHYQESISWNKLCFAYDSRTRALTDEEDASTRDVDFVIAKATEGVSMVDARYSEFKSGCKKAGFTFGAYHYYKPGVSSSKQAQNFIKTAKLSSGNLRPVLDVEEHGLLTVVQLREGVLGWLQAVEKKYGCVPILYCNVEYYSKYFATAKFKKYPIWIASYTHKPIVVDYIMWQQTDKGIARGIKGNVDIDVFNGKPEAFRQYIMD